MLIISTLMDIVKSDEQVNDDNDRSNNKEKYSDFSVIYNGYFFVPDCFLPICPACGKKRIKLPAKMIQHQKDFSRPGRKKGCLQNRQPFSIIKGDFI